MLYQSTIKGILLLAAILYVWIWSLRSTADFLQFHSEKTVNF